MGNSVTDAVAKDHQLVNSLEIAVKALKRRPQGFNGPLGFAFFEWLDDAERNAALCSSGAATQADLQVMAGKPDKAKSPLHLAQSRMDVSTLNYTVSENAGSLFGRYVAAEEQLAIQGAEAAEKCVNILKKRESVPPMK